MGNASPVSDAMIEAGWKAFADYVGYSNNRIAAVYLAMEKAKEEASAATLFERMRIAQSQTADQSPADEVERMRSAILSAGVPMLTFSDADTLARAALSAIKGQQPTVDVERLVAEWWNKLPVYDDGGAPDRASITRAKLTEIISSAAIRNGDEGMGS